MIMGIKRRQEKITNALVMFFFFFLMKIVCYLWDNHLKIVNKFFPIFAKEKLRKKNCTSYLLETRVKLLQRKEGEEQVISFFPFIYLFIFISSCQVYYKYLQLNLTTIKKTKTKGLNLSKKLS